MSLFFVTFFSLYAALHAYVFVKAWNAFRFRPVTGAVIAMVFFFCLFAPLMVRTLEQGGQESLARIIAYAGYIWMSAIFIFFILSLSIDILRFFVIITSSIAKINLPRLIHSSMIFFLASAIVSIGITAYGYYEARAIRTERIGIETSKLPPGVDRFTIVQISDVHLGLVNRDKRLLHFITTIEKIDPDVVVSTGDLVDGQLNDLDGLSDILNRLNPRYGKYAIMGNHEFYAGVGLSERFTRKGGFKLLRHKAITVGNAINLVGVDDMGHGMRTSRSSSEKELLEKVSSKLFTVFLKHRPLIEASSLGLFDIQLSGHTHGGQIFPFRYVTRISFPYVAGLYPLTDDSVLYVSRGTGTWGPPIRFLTPPEITVIEIIRKGQ
ncbi:MAG: metallophosphoesterase [Syntrophorhabdaceae bacterium]